MADSLYRQVKAHPTACISPAATIMGDVTIGAESSVFSGVQMRGDEGRRITIGARTNVQESVIIHISPDFDTTIGDDITIGHGAIVHGCTVEDNVLIGMGSIVLDGATIRRNSLVGAGALVTGGKDFPENSLILGSPARVARTLSDEEVERLISRNAREYIAIGKKMVAEGMMFHPDEEFCVQNGGE